MSDAVCSSRLAGTTKTTVRPRARPFRCPIRIRCRTSPTRRPANRYSSISSTRPRWAGPARWYPRSTISAHGPKRSAPEKLLSAGQQTFRQSHSRPATDGPLYDRYGVGIGQLDGWWGHTGSALGFQAAVFYDPRNGAVIATAVNASPLDDTPRSPDDEDRGEPNIAEEIFRALAAIVANP